MFNLGHYPPIKKTQITNWTYVNNKKKKMLNLDGYSTHVRIESVKHPEPTDTNYHQIRKRKQYY